MQYLIESLVNLKVHSCTHKTEFFLRETKMNSFPFRLPSECFLSLVFAFTIFFYQIHTNQITNLLINLFSLIFCCCHSETAKVSSFTLSELLDGATIRYVQSEHKHQEPRQDSFVVHASDGSNASPPARFELLIEVGGLDYFSDFIS